MPDKEPTQRTQPKKGDPIEIPVPKRDELFDALGKAIKKQPGSSARSGRGKRRPSRGQ